MRADGLAIFEQETNPFDDVNQTMAELGLTACAED